MNIEGLDRIDNEIVSLLREDARMSFSDIGKKTGISRVAVKNRVDRLEKNGIIRGYHALIDQTAVPDGINFTLDIEVLPEYYSELLERLAAMDIVHQIYGTSGRDHIHARGTALNSDTLGSNARHLHRSAKGIRQMNWQILMTVYKDTERGIDYENPGHEHMEAGRQEGEGDT